jgi:hypothetical protein
MEYKGTHHNGSQQIMSLWEGMGLGLKILVSAIQSRPCPPFHLQFISAATLNPRAASHHPLTLPLLERLAD